MDIYYARSDGADELWCNTGNGTYRLATEEAGLGRTAHHRYVNPRLMRCIVFTGFVLFIRT